MTLKSVIENFEDVPLSDFTIKHCLKDKINIISYLDLINETDILNIFKKDFNNNVILHFPDNTRNTGHWVALWLDDNNFTIHFYDPYGDTVDTNIKQSALLQHSNNKTKYSLTHLLDKFKSQGGNVLHNPYRNQKMLSSIQTCGRWCIIRLMHKDMNDEEFKNYIKFNDLNPDFIITMLTYVSTFKN